MKTNDTPIIKRTLLNFYFWFMIAFIFASLSIINTSDLGDQSSFEYTFENELKINRIKTSGDFVAVSSILTNYIDIYHISRTYENFISKSNSITGVMFSPIFDFRYDLDIFVSMTSPVSFGIWTISNNTKIFESDEIDNFITDIDISNDGSKIAIGGTDTISREALIYDVLGGLLEIIDLEPAFTKNCSDCSKMQLAWTQTDEEILALSLDSEYGVIEIDNQVDRSYTPIGLPNLDSYQKIVKFEVQNNILLISTEHSALYSPRGSSTKNFDYNSIKGYDMGSKRLIIAKGLNSVIVISRDNTDRSFQIKIGESGNIVSAHITEGEFGLIFTEQSLFGYELNSFKYDPTVPLTYLWALWYLIFAFGFLNTVSLFTAPTSLISLNLTLSVISNFLLKSLMFLALRARLSFASSGVK